MRVNEIQDLIKFVSKSNVSEIQLETSEVKLTIKNESSKRRTGGKNEGEQLMFPQGTYVQQIPQQQMQVVPQQQSQPVAQPATSAPVAAEPAPKKEDTSKLVEIKSPMIGTFYRRPSPDKELFVNVGDEIKPGDVICVIEAMKLFNEIESEVSGKIVKILADDASPVEYDQPLFLIDPS